MLVRNTSVRAHPGGGCDQVVASSDFMRLNLPFGFHFELQ